MDNATLFTMAVKVGVSMAAINLITSMISPSNTGIVTWTINETSGLRGL